MHFATTDSTLDQRKKLQNSNINLCLKSGAEEITVCNVASSYSMDVKEVYSMGKCVKLYCDTIERYLEEEKNLNFT